MKQVEKYPKLPKEWKQKFLNKLRNKCYRFVRGNWVKPLTIDEQEKDLEEGQFPQEYGYCVLGAAYHFSAGENQGPNGFMHSKVPKAFKDGRVRSIVMNINDRSSYEVGYSKVADWIEENL